MRRKRSPREPWPYVRTWLVAALGDDIGAFRRAGRLYGRVRIDREDARGVVFMMASLAAFDRIGHSCEPDDVTELVHVVQPTWMRFLPSDVSKLHQTLLFVTNQLGASDAVKHGITVDCLVVALAGLLSRDDDLDERWREATATLSETSGADHRQDRRWAQAWARPDTVGRRRLMIGLVAVVEALIILVGVTFISLGKDAQSVLGAHDQERVILTITNVVKDCGRSCGYAVAGTWVDPRTGANHHADVVQEYNHRPPSTVEVIASPSHPGSVVQPKSGSAAFFAFGATAVAIAAFLAVLFGIEIRRQRHTPAAPS